MDAACTPSDAALRPTSVPVYLLWGNGRLQTAEIGPIVASLEGPTGPPAVRKMLAGSRQGLGEGGGRLETGK